MVVLGFTVTYVRRRQVPNTCGSCTLLPFAVSSLGNVDFAICLPCGSVLHLFWLGCPT